MHHYRISHLSRGLHRQSYYRSSYLDHTNALGVETSSSSETQIANHGGFRGRHIVCAIPTAFLIGSGRRPLTKTSSRACAAIIARTVENYRLDNSDATYSVQIIMLWA